MQEKLARIRYQCRRGMLELDAILQPFFETSFQILTSTEQNEFERLLTSTDQELYTWFIGSSIPPDVSLQALVTKIKDKIASLGVR